MINMKIKFKGNNASSPSFYNGKTSLSQFNKQELFNNPTSKGCVFGI